MPTDCHPDWMAFDDRMTEAAGILAAGILRGRKREMNQMKKGRTLANAGLDVFADKSVHSTKSLPKRESR